VRFCTIPQTARDEGVVELLFRDAELIVGRVRIACATRISAEV